MLATTRYVYEKKLRRLLEPKVPPQQNGSGDQAMYSDSEGEENEVEEEEEEEQPGKLATCFQAHLHCLGINNFFWMCKFTQCKLYCIFSMVGTINRLMDQLWTIELIKNY